MYGNPVIDCDGAQIRAQCRQLATVVTVSGVVDARNIERVSAYVRRFILTEKPIVLDLSGVNSFTAEAVSLLDVVDMGCLRASVEWSLITSPAVDRTLDDCDVELNFPAEESVPEALNNFADAMRERRRLLPLLTKSA